MSATEGKAPAKTGTRSASLTPQAIAEAALRIAADKGVAGITTRKLGEALGYAHTAVYLHFPTRDDLLKAVFDLAVSRAPRDISREGTWEDRVRAVCSAIRRTLLDHPVCYELAQRFPARGVGMWADDMLMIARGAGYADDEAVGVGLMLAEVAVGLTSNTAHRSAGALGKRPGDEARPEERALAVRYAEVHEDAVFDTVVECLIDGLRRRIAIKKRTSG